MTLVRRDDFLGFDENIDKYQDWDAWLNMLENDREGIFCDNMIFTTAWVDHGYTRNMEIAAHKKVRSKYFY